MHLCKQARAHYGPSHLGVDRGEDVGILLDAELMVEGLEQASARELREHAGLVFEGASDVGN